MSVDVLLGLQWGDEGKGKIVDVLAPKYDVVARFQGGPNAGHTLEFGNIKHVLHQIPSGIFHRAIKNVIGNGVVLDVVILKKEIEALDQFSIDFNTSLFISKKAQLILPTHKLLDAAYEQKKGSSKIGSTLKGIGPTYEDKISRIGLRVGDLLSNDFSTKYDALKRRHVDLLKHYKLTFDLDEYEQIFFEAIAFVKTLPLVDSEYFVHDAMTSSKKVLAEGAQGSLLDIDFGSYPFVTSSSTMAAGACVGLGVAPNKIGEVYGIFKAYCTRVGSGPFPTELFNEVGEALRKEGCEVGATTGRARRCGWLDIPALKYAIMINGVTQLFMTKADVLNTFEQVQVCVSYQLSNGDIVDTLPYDLDSPVEPVYEVIQGWKSSLEGITEYDRLPIALKDYVAYLESKLQVPISIVSIGPNRTQTIFRDFHC